MAASSEVINTAADGAENREPRETRGRGKKATLRDVMSSMEARVARLEVTIGDMREKVEDLEGRIDGLDSAGEELEGRMQGALNEAMMTLNEKDAATEALVVAMREEMEELKRELSACKATMEGGVTPAEMEELKRELFACKAAIGGGVLAVTPTQRVDVPKPKEFKGSRSAKDVDNFLWGMDQYFRAMRITEGASKVSTAVMYLTDIALIWWHRRCDDRCGGAAIETWEDFQREFLQQFYPKHEENEARAKLRRLSQRGGIKEYVKEFSDLMLQISNLGENEAFFLFMDGLKPWVKQELERRDVEDLT